MPKGQHAGRPGGQKAKAETKYLIYFSNRIKYFQNEVYNEMKNGYGKLGKSLWKFYETISDN
jgi:hypothetical protein